jgi:putative chitinase
MDINKLEGHIPMPVIQQIPRVVDQFKINTSFRLAHFLAQCGHESGQFNKVFENLNYGAAGLMKTFPKYFPSLTVAKQYERKPQAIGSRVYANRMGNGNEASLEGYKFRGRGYIQLTGKSNYMALSNFLPGVDLVANPDLVATQFPLVSAAWFWTESKGLNKTADLGAADSVVRAVTKLVNGGFIGLPDRLAHFKEYYNLLK